MRGKVSRGRPQESAGAYLDMKAEKNLRRVSSSGTTAMRPKTTMERNAIEVSHSTGPYGKVSPG